MFRKAEKRLQLHIDHAETTRKQLAITSTQSTYKFCSPTICHVLSRPQSNTMTDNQDLPLTYGLYAFHA